MGEIFHYGFWFPYFFRVCGFPSFIFIKLPIILAFATCFNTLNITIFSSCLARFHLVGIIFTCAKIPQEWKPAITVKVLPAMETILYGDNLSNVLATITTEC